MKTDEIKINRSLIRLLQGDITLMETDAIVNAANSYLKHGGGVAAAISKKGGPVIQKESENIGFVEVGNAVVTSGGDLKAKYVIHAVGPRMGEGKEEKKLRSATQNALKLMKQKDLKSISFPAISSGIFGYPIEKCAEIMIGEAKKFLENENSELLIQFVLWTDKDYNVFLNILKGL